MKSKIIIIALFAALLGCKTIEPTVIEKTVTKTDTAYIQFEDEYALKSLFYCDSNYQVVSIENDRLKFVIDSLRGIGARIIYKKVVMYRDTTITKVLYKQLEPKIVTVKKVHPLTWAAFGLCFIFFVCFVITLLLLFKKIR